MILRMILPQRDILRRSLRIILHRLYWMICTLKTIDEDILDARYLNCFISTRMSYRVRLITQVSNLVLKIDQGFLAENIFFVSCSIDRTRRKKLSTAFK